MTLLAAWIRESGSSIQLNLAADSRLSFGARWDCCPKIVPLIRNDSALAFCGATLFAYPMLLQLSNAIRNYPKAESRELDIAKLRPHFLKTIDSMRSQVTNLPQGEHGIDTTDFKILLAGWSSKMGQFKAWSLHFDAATGAFGHRAMSFHQKHFAGTKPFLFMGDRVREAYHLLREKLKERGKLTKGGLDMEPLEILVDMCESDQYPEIGGPPQLVRIYSYASVLPINVLWPRNHSRYVAYFGRPLLSYEGSKYACLDLNNMELLSPQVAQQRLEP
ncbi:MAG TPA: hypothetical protein VFS60_19475 [Thermoanaerobaculia bacterium]|nr:hypothetical protein [Thermoanaerobaculia bacterium]